MSGHYKSLENKDIQKQEIVFLKQITLILVGMILDVMIQMSLVGQALYMLSVK